MHHFQAHQTVHIDVLVDFFNPQGKTIQNASTSSILNNVQCMSSAFLW